MQQAGNKAGRKYRQGKRSVNNSSVPSPRVEEARRKAPEPAVAKARVRFLFE